MCPQEKRIIDPLALRLFRESTHGPATAGTLLDAVATTRPETKPPAVGRGLSMQRRTGFTARPRRLLFVFGRDAIDGDDLLLW